MFIHKFIYTYIYIYIYPYICIYIYVMFEYILCNRVFKKVLILESWQSEESFKFGKKEAVLYEKYVHLRIAVKVHACCVRGPRTRCP